MYVARYKYHPVVCIISTIWISAKTTDFRRPGDAVITDLYTVFK